MAGEVARVADFAERLRRYLWTTYSAVNFFVFGMAIAAYWLIGVSLGLKGVEYSYWAAGMAAVVVLCVAVLEGVEPRRGVKEELSREGLRWAASFILPFIAVYAVACWYPSLFVNGWYLALGLAMLLAHLTLERPWVSRGSMVAKPFLFSAALILPSYVLVEWSYVAMGATSSWLLALGLMLTSYFTAGVYALLKAARLFR